MSSGRQVATNPQDGGPELTPRTCRYCRRFYLAEKGTRPHACPQCAPTLMDAIEGRIEPAPAPQAAPGELGAPDQSAAVPAPPAFLDYPQRPHWSESECQVKGCGEPSALNIDGWIVCVECADNWLDRVEAIERYPALREMLPALGDR